MLQQKLYQERTECTEFKQHSTWKHTVSSKEKCTKLCTPSQHYMALPTSKIIQVLKSKSMSCQKSKMMELRERCGLGIGGARREIRRNIYQKLCLPLATYSQVPIYQGSGDQQVKLGWPICRSWSFSCHQLEGQNRKRTVIVGQALLAGGWNPKHFCKYPKAEAVNLTAKITALWEKLFLFFKKKK